MTTPTQTRPVIMGHTTSLSWLMIVAAVVIWCLAAAHVYVGNLSELDEGLIGLAFYGASSIL
jgi:hypothetical protein